MLEKFEKERRSGVSAESFRHDEVEEDVLKNQNNDDEVAGSM